MHDKGKILTRAYYGLTGMIDRNGLIGIDLALLLQISTLKF